MTARRWATLSANNNSEFLMPIVQIDRIHSDAVCREIAERLPAALGSRSNELPARLLALMDQLQKLNLARCPQKFGGI